MLRFSTALRNFLLEGGSVKQALANGRIQVYTGAQPATADSAVAGTLLATITLVSGAFTAEVAPIGSVTLDTGASGSLNTLTVGGIEIMGSATAFNATLAQTAADVVTKINLNPKNQLYVASLTATATITLTAKPGLGTIVGGLTVASTATTITKTDVNMTAGTDALNGLMLGDAAAGTVAKPSTLVWSGVAVADGSAGWFRFLGSKADAGSTDSAETYVRLDGSVATSGANLNMSATNFVTGATETVSSFALTAPAA